ncbi:unnamed protein product, partial [Prunus brigantina]
KGSNLTCITPAAAKICCPWQMDAIGFLASTICFTNAITFSSNAKCSGGRPPGKTNNWFQENRF